MTMLLPRYSAFGRELEATEPDAKAYFTKYDVARNEIERLTADLDRIRRLAGEMWGTTGASAALKRIWLTGVTDSAEGSQREG